MNTTLAASKRSKPLLCRLLRPQPPSYLLSRHFCTELNPQSPTPPTLPRDDESKITQAVQLLLETPHQEWSSSQSLQSLLFSSSPPSPHFFMPITRRLPSSGEALDFFKYLQENSPSQEALFLSYPFQALLEQAGRAVDSTTNLSQPYQASKEWGIPLNCQCCRASYSVFRETVDESVYVFNELDPSLKNTHVCNDLIDVLLRDGRVDHALNVLDEMLEPSSEVPPDDLTGDIVFYALVKKERKGRSLSEEDLSKLVLRFGEHCVFPKGKLADPIGY